MPGVTWKTWEPFYMKETDNLIDTWVGRVRKFLAGLENDRISSRSLKKAVHAEKVHPSTWKLVIQGTTKQVSLSKKESNTGNCLVCAWKLEGQSLVRQTAEAYGFTEVHRYSDQQSEATEGSRRPLWVFNIDFHDSGRTLCVTHSEAHP